MTHNVSIIFLYSDGITEEYLRSLFTSTGGNVVNFRFFQLVISSLVCITFSFSLLEMIYVWL